MSMKTPTSFLILLFLMLFITSPGYAEKPEKTEKDLVKQAQNISVGVPPTGSALLGTPESMSEYNIWLIQCAYQLISLFNQIVDLLDIPGMDYTKNMQKTLETGMTQANALKFSK